MSYMYDASLSKKMCQNITRADLHPQVQNTMKHHLLIFDNNCNPIYSYDNGYVGNIIDDIWTEIFYFLNFKSIIHISCCCKHFHMITNSKQYYRIHKYWEWKCKTLCNDIQILNHTTDDWHTFFISLYSFMKRFKYFDYFNDIHDYKLCNTHKHFNKDFPITIGTDKDGFCERVNVAAFSSVEFAHHTICLPCIQDNLQVFKLLIKYIDNINDNIHHCGYDCYMSPLGVACVCNSCKIAEYLLNDSDIDVQLCQTSAQYTPLILATTYGSINIVKLLLKHPKMSKDGINKRTNAIYREFTPLHCTFCPASADLVKNNRKVMLKIAKILMSDKRTDPNSMEYPSKSSPVYDAIAFPDYYYHLYQFKPTDDPQRQLQLLSNAAQIALFLISCDSVDVDMEYGKKTISFLQKNNKTVLELCSEYNQTEIKAAILRKKNKDRLMKLYKEHVHQHRNTIRLK